MQPLNQENESATKIRFRWLFGRTGQKIPPTNPPKAFSLRSGIRPGLIAGGEGACRAHRVHMLNRRQARMAERSGGLGHIVTPADRLARIAHDPQHVSERQLAGCGCFLPHLVICTAGRSLGAASARPFSTVSVHRAIARLIENRWAVTFVIRFTCTTIRYSALRSARARYRFVNREAENRRPT